MAPSGKSLALLLLIPFSIWLLVQAGDVVVPFILAGIFAFALNPIVSMLSKYVKLPRALSILVVYIILIGLIVTTLFFITTRLIVEFREVSVGPPVDVRARQVIDNLPTWEVAGQDIGLRPFALQTINNLGNFTSDLESRALAILSGGLRIGVYFLLFLVTAFYLVKDGRKLKTGLVSFVPEKYRDDFQIIWGKLQVILGNYLRGQLLLMLIIGVLAYALLEILEVKYALILAIMAGLLEIVPLVGPTISTVLAVIVAFFTAENRFGFDPQTLSLIVLAGFVVIQQLENYVIVPAVFNRLTSLHPAVVMFSIIIGGAVFGPLGAILAVPATASLKTIVEYLAQKDSL